MTALKNALICTVLASAGMFSPPFFPHFFLATYTLEICLHNFEKKRYEHRFLDVIACGEITCNIRRWSVGGVVSDYQKENST